jgi:hypothetical protein
MKKILLSLCVLVSTASAFAQAPIVTTVVGSYPTTNIVDIPSGQAARVATVKNGVVYLSKDAWTGGFHEGEVVQGPARFSIVPHVSGSLVTLERWPIAEADQFLTLPQGSNTVAVALQSSDDLVKWSTATNGLYSTPTGAKFFRVSVRP